MRNSPRLFLLCLGLFLSCHRSPTATVGNELISRSMPALHWEFQEDPKDIVSPGRGFYSWNTQDADKSLVLLRIVLAKECAKEILDQSLLDSIAARFDAVHKIPGKQAIVRVLYADDGKLNACDSTEAAQPQLVIKHLQQLAPIFKAHRSDIAFFEAGFYGMWGEWNSEYAPSGVGYAENPELRFRLVRALLDNLPEDLLIMLRRPRFHEELQSRITSQDMQRLGFHNDCYLANETDMGTYDGARSPDDWRNYISARTPKGQAIGGETCADTPAFTSCPAAKADLKKLGMTYLNTGWNPAVLQRWRDEGCFDEIAAHLGYRFVLTSAGISKVEQQTLHVDFSLKNEGYAPAYQSFQVELQLMDQAGQIFPTKVLHSEQADPRLWLSGQAIQGHIVAQADSLPAGTYTVYIRWKFADRVLRFPIVDSWNADQQSYRLGDLTL